MDNTQYISSRKIAVIIAMLVLLFGTISYFATSIADRNNEMMYKEIYGENVTINTTYIDMDNASNTNVNVNTAVKNVKTALV